MDGMKLFPKGQFTWLVSFFLVVLFFNPISNPQLNFYIFWGTNFIPIFFGPPLNQSFFWEAPTYTQPTYHPSSYQPTSFPHVAKPSPPCHLRSFLTLANVLLTIAIAITRGA
jgi:hypothetical protein